MNFKKIYKSANDNIHGDKNLIDVIYNKSERKIPLSFNAPALCTAALLVVLTVGFASHNFFSPTTDEGKYVAMNDGDIHDKPYKQKDADKEIYTKSNDTNEDTTEGSTNYLQKVDTTVEDTLPKEQLNAAREEFKTIEDDIKSAADDIGYKVNPSYEHARSIKESITQASPEHESHDVSALPDANSTSPSVKDNTKMSKPASGGSSGGGGSEARGATVASVFSLDPVKAEYMTIAEYIDYLDIDIMSLKPTLPKGMEIKFPPIVTIEKMHDGAITNDLVTFSAEDENNPNRIITLATSKLDCTASSVMSDASIPKININSHLAAVSYDDVSNKAYFKYKDVWVSTASVGITKEEFDKFLSTLLK